MLVRIHLKLHEPPLQRRLRRLLEPLGVAITAGDDDETAGDVLILREELIDGEVSALVTELRALPDQPDLVVMTRSREAEHRSRLLAQGVRLVLGVREDDAILGSALAELVQSRAERLHLHLQAQQASPDGDQRDFITQSPAMAGFMRVVHKVMGSDTTVLLEGETGVGKERLARMIHDGGPRHRGPFVAVNCGALPETLIEAELFGHERGAFTDAQQARRGKFELAHGGSIFLDEIGDVPQHLQVKLLRVLQEREIQRLGSEAVVPVDVRVIGATNANLKTAVREGRFRSDLYYRLAVVTLAVPPLRDRAEDIAFLAVRFLDEFSRTLKKTGLRISREAMRALEAYSWPGNVRELMNVMERAVLLAEGDVIDVSDLPEEFSAPGPPPTPDAAAELQPPVIESKVAGADMAALLDLPWPEAREHLLNGFERWYLAETLRRTGGKIGRAAEIMQINPRSLYDKMRRHGLDKSDFRAGSG